MFEVEPADEPLKTAHRPLGTSVAGWEQFLVPSDTVQRDDRGIVTI